MISFPSLFEKVVDAYAGLVKALAYDRLAAVPYAALPVASALAMKLKRSLIYPRKEAKGHGTGELVEGSYEPGQVALVLEDVVTSGGSLLQAIATLEAAGLKVQDVVVLVDREQGGGARLAAEGRRLHTVLTLDRLLAALRDARKIDGATDREVRSYLASQGR